jgi:3-hydroxybutyrate dehydrogenase
MTVETSGRLGILVSNADIQIAAPFGEFEFAEWKQKLAIHLDGAFLTTRAARQRMYRRGTGASNQADLRGRALATCRTWLTGARSIWP